MDFEHAGDVVVSQAGMNLDAGTHDGDMQMEFEHIEEQPMLMDTGNEEIIGNWLIIKLENSLYFNLNCYCKYC